jgi:type I restriction enzyme S subunit
MSEGEQPEGWAETTLGSVCSKPQYGWTTPAKKSGEGLRLLRTTDISGGEIDWGTVPVCEIEPDDPDKYRLCAGDIVVSRAGSVGVSHILRACPPAAFASYLIRFRPLEDISGDFVSLFLQSPSYWSAITEGTAGIAIPNINASKLSDLVLSLPPLAEQRRIVEKVEALLAQVNAARARLAKVPTILKRFRKSVLAAACAGRLTETWRKSALPDANAEDEIPGGWRSVTIGQVAKSLDNLRRPINKDERAGRAGAIPYYGANGRVGWIDDWIFDEALVLVVEDETFIGRELPFSYVIRGKSWVNNHAHVLRPIDGMTADYLNICLAFYDFIPLTSGTTGRRKLTKGTLMAAPLTVAPLEEQHEIVRRVDALFKLADAIEARVAAATARADKITQAILAKAFRGELVPTEAELARQEGRDYEPASALLARIHATRATNNDKPTRRPSTAAATPSPAATKLDRRKTSGRNG